MDQLKKTFYEKLKIKIFRPPNYSGFLLLVLVLLMIACVLYVKRNDLGFLYNRTTWSFIVIVSFFFFSLLAKYRSYFFALNRGAYSCLYLVKCGIK